MPTVPPEGTYTEAELRFIETQPPGLWPENQDSNFGQLRKVITDEIQAIRDEVDRLDAERYIPTSTDYLALWEEMFGAVISPAGKTDAARRAVIQSRMKYGRFTRSTRDAIIESYLATTFGPAAALGPGGIPIPAGGIPLYGGEDPVSSLYRVYEDPINFSYEIWIKNTSTPDLTALTRDLQRITPAGISFTIDNSKTNILDYQRDVLTDGPTLYAPLATLSGTGNPWQSIVGISLVGTPSGAGGGPNNVTSLIANGGGVVAENAAGARDFNGTDHRIEFPSHISLEGGIVTVEIWANLDVLPSPPSQEFLINKQAAWALYAEPYTENFVDKARFVFSIDQGAQSYVVARSPQISAGTLYHVVGWWDGEKGGMTINDVDVTDVITTVPVGVANAGTAITVGSLIGGIGTHFIDGKLDEPAVYGYILPRDRISRHHKTGINVA